MEWTSKLCLHGFWDCVLYRVRQQHSEGMWKHLLTNTVFLRSSLSVLLGSIGCILFVCPLEFMEYFFFTIFSKVWTLFHIYLFPSSLLCPRKPSISCCDSHYKGDAKETFVTRHPAK